MKRKDSKESPNRTQSVDTATGPSSPSAETPIPSPQKSLSHAIDDNNDEPLVSERAGQIAPRTETDANDDRRVQFDKTKINETATAEHENDEYNENPDDKKKKTKG